MEILYPLVISAIAVLVTLTYASYLDIQGSPGPVCILAANAGYWNYLCCIPPVADNCQSKP